MINIKRLKIIICVVYFGNHYILKYYYHLKDSWYVFKLYYCNALIMLFPK
jgi:hypothetical protein